MIRKAIDNKIILIALAITLISLVTITNVLTGCFSPPNFRVNADTGINQTPKPQSLSTILTDINETGRLNADSFYNDSLSAPTTATPISTQKLNSATNKQPNLIPLTPPHFSFPDKTNPPPLSLEPISLNIIEFITYTYGGYSVQQPEPSQLLFSFPDSTNQGQIAGSDAITLDTYAIQKIDFDSVFASSKIGALGFDEMAIFAASDTTTYKGTEFGIRLDLNDGFLYGYIQESNGNYGEVNFQMLKLMSNDGVMHHYTVIILGLEVSFYIDGIDVGHLNFFSNTDYSNLTFSILAVVHRFTDNWDSSGNYMLVENFFLNQQ